MDIKPPYLIFIADADDDLTAKTGHGIVTWRPEWAVGQLRFPGCGADLGIPDMTIAEAASSGVKTFVIGTVNFGGVIPDDWADIIVSALENGMDVASGLHTPLESIPPIHAAAQRTGRRLLNVRHPPRPFKTGNGEKRPGRRLLTVGTDCSIGKMYTALAIARGMQRRGMKAEFCATGQTGIFIAGRGVAVDAVVADFIAGAAEWLSPSTDPDQWHVIEGQGSLLHPAFAGVTLGLLHGSQPDAFVVCHDPTRTHMRQVTVPIPTIDEVIDLTVRCGRGVNPDIRCAGIALNTHHMTEEDARRAVEETSQKFSLPTTDPIRMGVEPITQALEQWS